MPSLDLNIAIKDENGNLLEESMVTDRSIGGYPSIVYKPSQKVPRSIASRENSLYTGGSVQGNRDYLNFG